MQGRQNQSKLHINESLAPHFLQQTLDSMKTDFHYLCTDGSNDTGVEKMNLLTVGLFGINTSMVNTRFWEMCSTTGHTFGTAATIFKKIDDVITTYQ